MQVYTTRPLSFAQRVTAHLALATTLLLAGCGGHSGSDPAQPQVKAQRLEAAANGGNADVAMNVPYANFTVSNNGDSYVVTDNVGNAGSQTFARGTRLDFTDVNVELDSDGPAAQIYRLYQAAFNRQADLPGLGFWLDFVDHGPGLSVARPASWRGRSLSACMAPIRRRKPWSPSCMRTCCTARPIRPVISSGSTYSRAGLRRRRC